MRVLVLAPHTDDGEFGCGATIARFVMEKHDVRYVAFSAAEKSVSPELPRDVLRKEVIDATAILGIRRANVCVLDFEVRDFPARRQEILQVMVNICREFDPSMVLLPSTADTHQDHQTVSQEGFRAFKNSSILGYELPWNNIHFNAGAFIIVNEDHVSRKMKALEMYRSQANRPYVGSHFMRNLAKVRGVQINEQYAEAFEAIRLVHRLESAGFVM